ncbi:MAG: energy-coupling factor transporter ATPase, partial [candidate division Zixibacteria bacterium]|nr:energy-coupling factor transporter ATPase [candidate division Zixibacteria bacterium]
GKEILALNNINLQIEEGEYITIIGPNGSGKTTLARLLNGLLLPSSGEILVVGLNSKDKEFQREIRLKVGMVFQNPDNQIVSTTVEREIAFGLENLALPYEEMSKRVNKALKDFDLEQYRLHPPHKLSGGEKQRVALASVLAMQPKYLVLDEATSLLDSKDRKDFLALMERLSHQGITLIHITQFPEEANLARRLVVLSNSKIVMDGSPLDIFQKVKELGNIGLDAPFNYRMSNLLARKGWLDQGRVYSIEEIADRIAQKIPNPDMEEKKKDKAETIIEVENLSFSYAQATPDHKKVLDGVGFKIDKGDLVGLIGPSGSGKSTLVQHLNGLLKPSGGKVIYRGKDINSKNVNLKDIRQKIALTFQFPELQLVEETVYDDIAFGPRNLGLDKKEVEKKVKDSMCILGLDFESFAFRSPFSLSEGEKRRVAIAGVLSLNPEVLILDEPTVGLDPQNTKNLKSIIRNLNQNGMTIILVSHNLNLIAEIAQKVILLNQGKIVNYCSKQEFFEDLGRLGKLDLEIPPTVYLVSKLKEKGINVIESSYDLEKLVQDA